MLTKLLAVAGLFLVISGLACSASLTEAEVRENCDAGGGGVGSRLQRGAWPARPGLLRSWPTRRSRPSRSTRRSGAERGSWAARAKR